MASPSFSWLRPSMFRRSRTREPTWISIGFGYRPFGGPAVGSVGASPSLVDCPRKGRRNDATDYTIVRDEQPSSTENKYYPRRASTGARVAEGDLGRGRQRSRNAIGNAPSRKSETRVQSPARA